MASLFDIGLSGVQAAKYAMYMTGHNISNALNPYYARRTFSFSDASSGFSALGVKIGDVRRVSDAAADTARYAATQSFSRYEALYSKLGHFESFFDDQTMGVDKLLSQALSALEVLNTSPSAMQNRNNYLQQLNMLTNRFHDIDQYIHQEMNTSISALRGTVDQVNALLGKLADMNALLSQQNTPQSAESMDLMDARDELLDKLSKLINFDKSIQENGSVNVYFQNGQPLLLQQVAGLFSVNETPDPYGRPDIQLHFQNLNMNANHFLEQGQIGGILDYYDDVLVPSQRSLDRMALVFAQKMNQQNRLGVDTDGALGVDLFNDINAAALMSGRVVKDRNNTGSADLSVLIEDASQLKTSDYVLNFIDNQHYQLMRLSDNQIVHSGELQGNATTIAIDGFSINMTSVNVSAGDRFMISPLNQGAQRFNPAIQDPGKLALGAPVIVAATSENQGSGKIQMTGVLDTSTQAFSIPGSLYPPIRVEFTTATTYRLVNANDNTILEDNLVYDPQQGSAIFPTPAGYDPGYRIMLSGNMQAGDSFSIDYNANGQGDNRNGLLFGNLFLEGTVQNDQLNFTQAYHQLVIDVSTRTHEAKNYFESSKIIKKQADMQRNEYAEVSPEEELLNMSQYQEYYMASLKVLETVKQNMDVLFSLLNGR